MVQTVKTHPQTWPRTDVWFVQDAMTPPAVCTSFRAAAVHAQRAWIVHSGHKVAITPNSWCQAIAMAAWKRESTPARGPHVVYTSWVNPTPILSAAKINLRRGCVDFLQHQVRVARWDENASTRPVDSYIYRLDQSNSRQDFDNFNATAYR